MSTRDYPRLGPVEFARQLIQTGDLDPIYVALNGAGYDRDQKLRWLCAYIAFYHAGVACFMSEHKGIDFWSWMTKAAENTWETPLGTRWPRSSERRHFRGRQACWAISDWVERCRDGQPEAMFSYIAGCNPGGDTLERTMDRAREYRSIGGWAAFKCADLVDACLDARLDQGDLGPFLYDTPRAGFAMMATLWGMTTYPGDTLERQMSVSMAAMNRLREQLSDLAPPHKPGQPIDNFVLETVACKWKSHIGGHYPPGKDLREIAEGLRPWAGVCESAHRFLVAMPKIEEVMP